MTHPNQGGSDRSVHARDITHAAIVTGDGNTVSFSQQIGSLPKAEEIDMQAVIRELATLLAKLESKDEKKIGRAIEDAQEEAQREQPNRDEIGSALERAIGYAKQASNLATVIAPLQAQVLNAAAWLGEHWHRLLPLVGLKP